VTDGSTGAARSSSGDWQEVQEIFLRAADLAPGEQSRYLDGACGANGALRREVEELLAADPHSEAAISALLAETASGALADDATPGAHAGPWRIVEEIGRGGMGAVYLAEREDAPFRQRAALKVIRRGMDTADLLARFDRERQILAALEHPHIARLIDGGSTADGRPFLAMEYVQGEAIDRYCETRVLSIEARLRLILKVCDAVSHAHRNLVVHRDLKPGNILIDAAGAPKLLDFGMAKILCPDPDAGRTEALSGRFFTPDYCSPEQVSGARITTASDVYSLGAILYELLSGVRPHRVDGGAPEDWKHAICDGAIPAPSVAAARRNTRPPRWRKRLQGDLDNIVLMALRKDPARRYGSAGQLAEDLCRYLEFRPVAARRDSVAYRVSKFLRRQRLPVTAGALVVSSLIGGMLIAMSQARRAEERAAEIVDLSDRSLSEIYSLLEHLPGAVAARGELVKTVLAFLERVSADPGQNRKARLAIATAYLRLGDIQGNPDAASLRDMSGALRTYRAGAASLALAGSTSDRKLLAVWLDLQQRIGTILSESGDAPGAIATLERALEPLRGLTADPAWRRRENSLYLSLARATQQADSRKALYYANRYFRGAGELSAANPGDLDLRYDLAVAHTQVGYILIGVRDLEGAGPHYRESIAIREELVRRRPENTTYRRALMLAYEHYAALQGNPLVANLGNAEAARQYYGKARGLEEEAFGDPQNLLARYDYANFLLRSAIIDVPSEGIPESIASLEKAAAMFQEFSAADPGIVRYRHDLATAHEFLGLRHLAAGDAVKALSEYRRAAVIDDELTRSMPDDREHLLRSFSVQRGIIAANAARHDRAAALGLTRALIARAEDAAGRLSDKNRLQVEVAQAWLSLSKVYRAFGDGQRARDAAGEAAARIRPLLTGRPHDPSVTLLREAEAALR
jgi:eukaryotic-like serine/threonine-protein kinase